MREEFVEWLTDLTYNFAMQMQMPGGFLEIFHLYFWQHFKSIAIFCFKTFGWIPHFEFYIFVILCTFGLYWLTRNILGEKSQSKVFWQHKSLAKRKIAWLNMLFPAILFLVFCTAFGLFSDLFCFLMVVSAGGYGFDVAILGVIGIAYVVKSISINQHSIDNLAKNLEATEITQENVLDSHQKMLLNIVEEMAIASSMKMPRVFIMENEFGVNAMCSGEKFGKSDERIAIFVTQGALKIFSREELQGVIGHEFSHAFHQDVALNLKIFTFVFALGFLMTIGEAMIRAASESHPRSNSKDNKGATGGILLALVFLILGAISSIFASIIQAAISRQKEFLADASSVQYTRNPEGIKSALQKLLAIQKGEIALPSQENENEDNQTEDADAKQIGKITNPKAKACSHMFFLSGFKGVFATHPSLEERIQSLSAMSQGIV